MLVKGQYKTKIFTSIQTLSDQQMASYVHDHYSEIHENYPVLHTIYNEMQCS